MTEPTAVPTCECHGQPMGWRHDPRKKAGGYWFCPEAYRAAERARYRANTGTSKPRPAGPPPTCSCHGEPKLWHGDKRKAAGGAWRCAVRNREQMRERGRRLGALPLGSPELSEKFSAMRRGRTHPSDCAHCEYGGDNIGYNAAHARAWKKLAGQPCAMQDPSCKGQLQAALRHEADAARLRVNGPGGRFYSIDTGDYWPLCKSHHKRYDLNGTGPGSARLPTQMDDRDPAADRALRERIASLRDEVHDDKA